MKASGRVCEGGKCEELGWVGAGGGVHRWEKLGCCPQATRNSTSIPSGKGTMGGKVAAAAPLLCHFGGKEMGQVSTC